MVGENATPLEGDQAPMVGRLFVAGAVLALILRLGGANADPQPKPMLVPPVSPTCISSPFGLRVLPNPPQAGTYHYGVDLPAPPGASIVATAPSRDAMSRSLC